MLIFRSDYCEIAPIIVELGLEVKHKMAGRKQDFAKIAAWQAANIDRIEIKPRKDLHVPERVAAAVAAGCAGSRQDYIITAICERLERDGFGQGETD